MQVRVTEVYLDWINSLKDIAGRARIQVRIDRLVQLAGGDKSTQERDIETAITLARNL